MKYTRYFAECIKADGTFEKRNYDTKKGYVRFLHNVESGKHDFVQVRIYDADITTEDGSAKRVLEYNRNL